VQAYAQAWLRGLERNLKASTVRFYRENLDRHVLPLLGDRPLASITRADGRELIAQSRQKGLRLNTVKGIARTLSTLLSQAVEDDKLPAHPCLRMGRYLRGGDEPKTVVQPLTRDEAAHLTVPDWVFASADGHVLEARNVRTVFARLLEKAGLRHIRIHDLRHTFASLLLQQGESVVYVKEQLGHASIQITVVTYGHLIPGANRAAVDGLDDEATHPAATQAQP